MYKKYLFEFLSSTCMSTLSVNTGKQNNLSSAQCEQFTFCHFTRLFMLRSSQKLSTQYISTIATTLITRFPRPIVDWPRSSLGFLAVVKSLVPGSSLTLSFPRRFFLLIVNLYTNKHQLASNTYHRVFLKFNPFTIHFVYFHRVIKIRLQLGLVH